MVNETRPVLRCHSGGLVDEGKLLGYGALKHCRMRFKCLFLELTNQNGMKDIMLPGEMPSKISFILYII